MSAFVDELVHHGWSLNGRIVKSCHLIADTDEELHRIAEAAGCLRSWFQEPPAASFPHYDLTGARRSAAIAAGAIALPRREFVAQLQRIRAERRARQAQEVEGS